MKNKINLILGFFIFFMFLGVILIAFLKVYKIHRSNTYLEENAENKTSHIFSSSQPINIEEYRFFLEGNLSYFQKLKTSEIVCQMKPLENIKGYISDCIDLNKNNYYLVSRKYTFLGIQFKVKDKIPISYYQQKFVLCDVISPPITDKYLNPLYSLEGIKDYEYLRSVYQLGDFYYSLNPKELIHCNDFLYDNYEKIITFFYTGMIPDNENNVKVKIFLLPKIEKDKLKNFSRQEIQNILNKAILIYENKYFIKK